MHVPAVFNVALPAGTLRCVELEASTLSPLQHFSALNPEYLLAVQAEPFSSTEAGEFLTRLTVWLAIVAGCLALAALLRADGRERRRKFARASWTIGCLFFLAHVACAFAFYHHWSHADAYRETARQTAAMTGWSWGGGLYFNYLFAAAWLADVLWSWSAPGPFARRPRCLAALWHGFFFFMVFNGTVVFGHGPVRWFGAILCGSLAALWWRSRSRVIAAAPPNS